MSVSLTDRQDAFCRHYVFGTSAAAAARSAGYAERTARSQAWRLLKDPAIQARIETLRSDKAEAAATLCGQLWAQVQDVQRRALYLGNHGAALRAVTMQLQLFERLGPPAAPPDGMAPPAPADEGEDEDEDEDDGDTTLEDAAAAPGAAGLVDETPIATPAEPVQPCEDAAWHGGSSEATGEADQDEPVPDVPWADAPWAAPGDDTLAPATDDATPESHRPDCYEPDCYGPDCYEPDCYEPDCYEPDCYGPDCYGPDGTDQATPPCPPVARREVPSGSPMLTNVDTASRADPAEILRARLDAAASAARTREGAPAPFSPRSRQAP